MGLQKARTRFPNLGTSPRRKDDMASTLNGPLEHAANDEVGDGS
jgi:hypothetical protein